MNIASNAKDLAHKFYQRATRTQRAVQAGLTRVANAINAKQIENLSGGGNDEAGGYPVPVRSGHLRRSAEIEVNKDHAFVFNDAEYAAPVHRTNGPFLSDAASDINLSKEFAAGVRHVMGAA